MQRIESNGLLFGINPDAEYPVCSVALEPLDRFLLYTDGVTEPKMPPAKHLVTASWSGS